MNKMMFTLSLCRKAGVLVKGFDAVQEAVMLEQTDIVMLAQDASAGTQKRVKFFCEKSDVKLYTLPLTQFELCDISKKPVAVYCVTDENLAKLCHSTMAQMNIEEERP